MHAIRTILHPTDFAPASGEAFHLACALARDYGARLVVLHVMPPSAAPLLDAPPPDPSRPAEAQEALRGRFPWPRPSSADVALDCRVAEGDADSEILRLAQASRCDLIVMGTSGRTGLGRLLLGSVAESVLRRAACPVLVVKAAAAGARPAPPQREALNPRDAGAYNSYAWLLATCPDDGVRNGPKAVELATKACELKNWQDPSCLETLGAACAEAGRFQEAVGWQKQALAFADFAREHGEEARRRLRLYQEGKPYRDTRFK
jgi:nucleotide-binding universal stress UspA family protein